MEIVTNKSEQLLVEMLSLIEKAPGDWMSLHVNIAPLHHQLLNREGLSKVSLAKINEISTQIAHQLVKLGLEEFNGNILVCADSDVLALFLKETGSIEDILNKIRTEFTKNNLIDILTIAEMKDRLAQLVIFSEEKKQSAKDHLLKLCAVEAVENLLEWSEPSRELKYAIQAKRNNRHKGCILVIEDDILMRGLMVSMLGGKHHVVLAKNAAEGIVSYIDNAPNIVFLDINLPDLKGLEVLRRLTQLDPQAHVVIVSGYSSHNNVVSSNSQGAVGFLCKPFRKEKFLEYVQQCPSMHA